MTLDDAIELVGRWPSDRTVPRRLAEGIAATSGREAAMMGQLAEALMSASRTEEDFALIQKHLGE